MWSGIREKAGGPPGWPGQKSTLPPSVDDHHPLPSWVDPVLISFASPRASGHLAPRAVVPGPQRDRCETRAPGCPRLRP